MSMANSRPVVVTLALLGVLLAPGVLEAQASRRPSLVITSEQQVGVVLPISDRLALRPDLAFGYNSAGGAFPASRVWFAIVGVSLLHTLHEDERLATYLAPRIATMLDGYDPDPGGESTSLWVSLAYGARGRVTERVAVFGEVGPQLQYRESGGVGGPSTTAIFRNWSVATTLGVSVRF